MDDTKADSTRAERAVRQRARQPVDLGLLLQRTAQMVEGSLDMLEDEFVDFKAKGKGIPSKFVKDLEGVSKLLNDLTLAHGRYRKAEDEWAEKMTVEERLEAMHGFLLALHKDQPDLVRKWASVLALALNHATAATLGVVKERARQPSDLERFEAADPGAEAWGP